VTPLTILAASGLDWPTILTAVAVVFGLVGSAGAVAAQLRGGALQASNDRLRNENEDYVRRLDYVEPRYEEQTKRLAFLETQQNYGPALEKIGGQLVEVLTEMRKSNGGTG
jgi:hypothetical protein